MDTKYDAKLTQSAAEGIAARIKKQFSVAVDLKRNVDGSMAIIVNGGSLANDAESGNANVATPKNLGAVIDDDFRQYRADGNFFSQPQSGKFTIGIKASVTEMDDSYADGGYSSMVGLPADMSITSQDPTVIPAVLPTSSVKNITVYANSISAVSYSDDDPIVAFDVVFSVGTVCPESGTTKTYQVVKRIGVDREKMACDAQTSTPVSIVEAKKPLKEGRGISTARFKALAGL